MKIHNFKELKVWQQAIDLAVFTYQLTGFFPKEERYGLTAQVQRSAISVPSNIAEGSGRNSNKDFQRFISIAMGSAFEMETQVILAHRFNYVTDEQFNEFEQRVTQVQRMSFGLFNSLENKG